MPAEQQLAPPHAPRLALQTLGGARVLPASEPAADSGAIRALLDGGKPVALLAYLASVPGRQARREQLVDLLWADLEPDAAKHALRQTIWYIKKRLGEGVLVATPEQLTVSDALSVDRDALLERAAANDHDAVLATYAGDFLPDFAAPGGADFEAWADIERRRLRSLYFRASEASVRDLLRRGKSRDAFARARRARDVDPSSQGAWRLVLESLIAAQEWTQAHVESDALERLVAQDEGELEPATRALIRVARKGEGSESAGDKDTRSLTVQLVGREREFAILLDAAAQTQRGRGAHVHVRAGAGLGKSRLLGDVAARLRGARVRVLQVRCDMGSRDLPYSAASDLALAMGALGGARGISPESASVLVAMAPGMSNYFSVEADRSAGSEALRRRTQALVELASAVSEEQALVLLIDDVHWMDAESRRVLGQLANRASAMRVLVVAAGRPVLEGRLEGTDARTVELPALSDTQCGELLESIASLGTRGNAPWAAAFVHDLWRATGGSPLHLLETLQLLRERELLLVVDGEWHAPDPDALFATLRAGGALARRLELLTRDQRWMLTLLAVAGIPLNEASLGAAAGRDGPMHGDLSVLEERGFVARSESGWGLAHDEIGAAVLERAHIEPLRAAHAALGRTLWQSSGGDLSTMRRAAHHLVEGEETAPLRALYGSFVRRMRALRDARGNAALAEELLGRHARGAVVQSLVESLPWHVRAGLTTTRRVTAAALLLLAMLALPLGVTWLRASTPPPSVPVAELLIVGSGGPDSSVAYRVPIISADWVPGRPLNVPTRSEPFVTDPWVSWPMVESPRHRGVWLSSRDSDSLGVIDLYVDSASTRRRVTFARGDDLLGDVSPDGTRAVISTARWNKDSHYDLAIVSLADGKATAVTQGDDTDAHAHWSHAGDRIAFVRRSWVDDSAGICIVNPDGSDLSCPQRWRGVGHLVGWIDEHHLALTVNDGNSLDVVVADDRDGSIRPLGLRSSEVPLLSPDGNWLACRCERLGYQRDTWFVMPLGRETEARPLYLSAAMASARLAFTAVGRPAPIASLSIDMGRSAPIVGVPHRFVARGILRDHLTDRLPRVRWSTRDTFTLHVDSLTGIATAHRPGRVRIAAALPGWVQVEQEVVVRADTAEPLIRESWDDRWKERWFDFGTPRPIVRDTPSGRALDMNGDGSFTSGALSTAVMDASHGLTIDFELGLRITSRQWQSVKAGVAADVDLRRVTKRERTDGTLRVPSPQLLACGVSYPSGEGVTRQNKYVAGRGELDGVRPLPPGVGAGRRLQARVTIFPDGRCGIAVDGRVVYVSEERVSPFDSVRIHLSGSAVGTQSLVGPIEVWRGVRPGVNWTAVGEGQRPIGRVPR